MWKKIAIAGGVAAAILGAGTAGLAATGPSSPSQPLTQPAAATTSAPSGGTSSDEPHGWHHWNDGDWGPGDHGMGRMVHGQWVTQDPDTKATATYDVITGAVTAVSASSITVKAADGFSQTYGVTADTKVWTRNDSGASASSIDQVKSGDTVRVFGTGTGPFTATHIAELPAGATDDD